MKPVTNGYLYEYDNGDKKTRDEAVKDILNFVGSEKYSMNQIAKGIGLNYTSTTSLVRWAKRNNIMYGIRRGRKYHFGVGVMEEDACLLADMFYNKEKILSNFKVISTTKRKVEDAPTDSFELSKSRNITYGTHVFNTVYD